MTANDFDFRKPPPTSLDGKITAWLREACLLAPRTWSRFIPFPVELEVARVTSMAAADALDRLPAPAVAFQLKVEGAPQNEPLLVFPRPLLLALINGSLGEKITELPKDHDLSAIETAVCDYLIRQLFLDILSASWPNLARPKFSVGLRGEPRALVTFPPSDLLLNCLFMVNGAFGSEPVTLLLPRAEPFNGLVKPLQQLHLSMNTASNEMAELVGEMSIDLSVPLGNTELTMLQIASLKAGDLLVLGQKVSEPLRAKIAGKDKFTVWPGAVGRRQAVQIDSPLEQ